MASSSPHRARASSSQVDEVASARSHRLRRADRGGRARGGRLGRGAADQVAGPDRGRHRSAARLGDQRAGRAPFAGQRGDRARDGALAPAGSYDKAALADLQRRELELSNHDLACDKRYVTPIEDAVRNQKEEVFRDRNADLLRKVKPLGS